MELDLFLWGRLGTGNIVLMCYIWEKIFFIHLIVDKIANNMVVCKKIEANKLKFIHPPSVDVFSFSKPNYLIL